MVVDMKKEFMELLLEVTNDLGYLQRNDGFVVCGRYDYETDTIVPLYSDQCDYRLEGEANATMLNRIEEALGDHDLYLEFMLTSENTREDILRFLDNNDGDLPSPSTCIAEMENPITVKNRKEFVDYSKVSDAMIQTVTDALSTCNDKLALALFTEIIDNSISNIDMVDLMNDHRKPERRQAKKDMIARMRAARATS